MLQKDASFGSRMECYLPSGGLLMLRLDDGVRHDSDVEQIAIAVRGEVGRKKCQLELVGSEEI
jgi:hypothetical protein